MATFWKPGTARPGSSLDRVTESDDAAALVNPAIASSSATRNATLSISHARSSLPIYAHRQALLYAVENHPVVVVVGQTGCGKTTQLPQYLMEAGWASSGHQIACTQPRRVAATSVAARVAQEAGSVLGDEVGYTIRFEDCSHPVRTRIKYLTDGILFRECMRDPLLSRYSVIIVDEAHERGAYTDLVLAILKKIMRKRPELRIIISSATIDAQSYVDFFSPDELLPAKQQPPQQADPASPPSPPATATIISLEGRMYPVELAYTTEACDDYVRSAASTVMQIHLHEPRGDVLVFLTGREEIDTCLQLISDRLLDLPPGSPGMDLLPLHAGLTAEEQAAVFAPPSSSSSDKRKVVVSTNLAEASVTIEGIRYVVDCGFVKLRTYDARAGTDVLSIVPESLASATQRAGRAGRTSSGKCFRLFPEEALSFLPATTAPELCRSDLALPLLQLKALGIENLARFEFLPPAPPAEMVARGIEFLASLGVLDDGGRLTRPLGEQMAEMPVEPMLAKVLLTSTQYNCTPSILSISAMTSISCPFLLPSPSEGTSSQAGMEAELSRRKFTAEEGDHLTLLNVFNAFTDPRVGRSSAKWCSTHRLNFRALSRAVNVRRQLERFLERFAGSGSWNGRGSGGGGENGGGEEDEGVRIRKCLTAGFFKNAARRLPDGSFRGVRDGAYVIYNEVVETSKRFIRDVSVIKGEWLGEVAPHYYESGRKKVV